MIHGRTRSQWQRAANFFFWASYLYLLSGFVYIGAPVRWSMRSTNLSPSLRRGIEFFLYMILGRDPHPKVMAIVFLLFVSLLPTAVFTLTDGWLERRANIEEQPLIRRTRFWLATGILILFLFFFGPDYMTS